MSECVGVGERDRGREGVTRVDDDVVCRQNVGGKLLSQMMVAMVIK